MVSKPTFLLQIQTLHQHWNLDFGRKCGDSSKVVSRRSKKVKSKDNVSKSTKNYEKDKRQWTFKNSWKQGRTWLVFDNNVMFLLSLQRGRSCGCDSKSQEQFYLQLESIKLQEKSHNHKSAKTVVAAKKRPCET